MSLFVRNATAAAAATIAAAERRKKKGTVQVLKAEVTTPSRIERNAYRVMLWTIFIVGLIIAAIALFTGEAS